MLTHYYVIMVQFSDTAETSSHGLLTETFVHKVLMFNSAVAMTAACLSLMDSSVQRKSLSHMRKKRQYMHTTNRLRTDYGFRSFYFFIDTVSVHVNYSLLCSNCTTRLSDRFSECTRQVLPNCWNSSKPFCTKTNIQNINIRYHSVISWRSRYVCSSRVVNYKRRLNILNGVCLY